MVAPSFEKLPNDISLDNRELLNFMDLTGVPSFVTDLDGRLVYSNTAGIEMLGLQGGHYFGSSFRDVLHPDDQALAAAQGQELLEGKVSTVSAERRYRHSAGHYIWVSVSVAVARRLDGSPKCITLQAINIDHHKRALLALTESEQRWNFALESAGQGVWEADRSTNTVFYSDTWKKLRGYRPDEQVDSSQAAWISRIHPRDRDRVLATIAKNNEGGSERASFEYRERHKDGHYIWIQSRGAPIAFYPDGSPLRVIGTDTDITELKRAERDGSALSHRLELALDVSGIGVFEADLETGALLFDRRMHDIFGTSSQDELNEEVFNNALHENDAADVLAGIEKAINARGTFSGRFRIRRPDGTVRTVMANSTFFEDTEGVAKFVGANWDITDDVELAERLNSALVLAESRYVEIESAKTLIEHQAFHDALTSLPNRRFLEDLLEKHASQPDGTITVLHIDVDRFKHINDTFGHAAGDALLRHVSAALQRLCEPGDFVARVGGDEFTMVRLGPQDRFSLDMLAERIIQSLRQPMTFAGHEFSCGASLGIATESLQHLRSGQLLIDADTALYRAKEKGRGRFEYFTPELRAEVRLFKQTADLLQQAIPAKQFVPFYQPVVDAQTLRLSSVEALARWLHPEEGVLSPARFLQTAEKLNIVDQIDELILKQAVADLRTWSSQGITVPSVSVNVSYKRLRQNNLLKSVADLGIVPGTVNFEFLESIFLDEADDELTLELDFLRELGIGIDIDDFGTGHTSFVSLFKLNPRRLKIDRQLIGPITQSAEQRKIVRSIIGIARTLEIEVVAEGVETMGHVKLLQRMGCDYLQGYAVARPMSSPDLVKWTLSRELTNDELQKKHAS